MKYKIVAPPENAVIRDESPLIHIVLTRYLYIKEEAMISLIIAIMEKKRDEALFWAYELYWSGFQEEVFEYLMSVFTDMFETVNPRLRYFLQTQVDSWKQDPTKHWAIGTMVRNLVDKNRNFNIDAFVLNISPVSDLKIKDRRFYIELEAKDIIQYETIQGELPRVILGKACRFSTKKQYNNIFGASHKNVLAKDILHASRMEWEYYASFSSVWKGRIEDCNGKIDINLKRVVFDDDDDQEEFYDQYGYEPDEQSLDLLSKITHVKPVVQMSLQEFCINFGAKKETLNCINDSSGDRHECTPP